MLFWLKRLHLWGLKRLQKSCPKCKRKGTYSEKFNQCSACGLGYESQPAKRIQDSRRHAVETTVGFYDPDEPIVREPVVQLVVGEPCPTCLRKVTEKSTERVKAWREKVKKERRK